MKRIYILIFTLSFGFTSLGSVNANGQDERHQFEKGLFELGYKTVEEAVNQCEKVFTEKIVLPYKIPPVQFTHYFGRCNKDFGINNTFEIIFLNKNTPENHYTLTLRPKKHAIKFKPEHIDKIVKLDNGKELFVVKRAANIFVFEGEDWQYFLGIDKRISKSVPLDVLVDIANSI
ncbi:hypothetical protein [Neobacillus sp. LXY-4]|uniref:hypothetical protein n=1 Tax=Neobacillus sp. LXY-4 TaxID=3379826 RepID=UPI003EE16B2F